MKIICTEMEKNDLLFCIKNSTSCPNGKFECGDNNKYESCVECFNDQVEWEIEDGEQG